jgi:serine protease Do
MEQAAWRLLPAGILGNADFALSLEGERRSVTTVPCRARGASLALCPLALGATLGFLVAWCLFGVLSPQRELHADLSKEVQLERDLEDLFASVAEKVKLSVVAIGTKDSPDPSSEGESGEPGRSSGAESIGSGFIIDPRGYLLTNHHLVGESTDITVRLHDNREVRARVVQADASSDLALLKVESEGLRALTMGDSKEARVGQWVLAIGNPFGLSQTVSAGIISALGRSDLRILPFENFIQTDASINPGNSGGPLVNLRGEAIGINTAMYSSTGGGNQGIGFAIPIDLARVLARRWIEGKSECYLGVNPARVDLEMARYFGLERPRGAFLAQVYPGSPAARGGLQSKDLILTFGEQEVRDESHLRVLIASAPPGQPVSIEVLRRQHRESVQVLLAEKERPGLADSSRPQDEQASPRARILGLTVAPVDPDLARQFGLITELRGLVVLDVQPGTPAGKKGLRQGDLVVEVNESPVKSLAELQGLLEASRDVVMLGLRREHGELEYVFLSR